MRRPPMWLLALLLMAGLLILGWYIPQAWIVP